MQPGGEFDAAALRAQLQSLGVQPSDCILVGVSGGLDSTVLLRLLHESGQPCQAAHVNYGLRGEASNEDARFVAHLCSTLGIGLHTLTLTPDDTAGTSRQDQARVQRYAFFEEVATDTGIGWIAVAHHQDDQAETVLLNLCRGAGIEGLQGMASRRPISEQSSVHLIRPLLEMPRAALEAIAQDRAWNWRTDRSNADVAYRRNALRHTVVPALVKLFGPDVQQRLAQSAHLLRGYDEAFVSPGLDQTWHQLQVETSRGGRLRMEDLEQVPDAVRWAMLLRAAHAWGGEATRSQQLAQELDNLRQLQVGRFVQREGYIVWREREYLTFTRTASEVLHIPVALNAGESFDVRIGSLEWTYIQHRPDQLDAGRDVAIVDADALVDTLTVRTWQDGDRMQPLGSPHTKLVSDLLTDAKVPPSDRAATLVVCDALGIVWLVGHRLADRVKVRAETRRYAKITFNRVKSRRSSG